MATVTAVLLLVVGIFLILFAAADYKAWLALVELLFAVGGLATVGIFMRVGMLGKQWGFDMGLFFIPVFFISLLAFPIVLHNHDIGGVRCSTWSGCDTSIRMCHVGLWGGTALSLRDGEKYTQGTLYKL